MSKTTVLYKDIAPGAALDAAITATAQPFAQPARLPFGGGEKPSISCELNHWGLNEKSVCVDSQTIPFWSVNQSDESGDLAVAPITIAFDRQYSSLGLTLKFDTGAGDYCTAVNIKWYQGATLKADVDFSPNSPSFFCYQKVTSFDRVVLTLGGTSLPYRCAKLNEIIFGIYRTFDMTEIRSASVVNEMSLIAVELPISTLNWTLDSNDDLEFMFQLKQPVEVSNDANLIGVYYIDGYSRTSKTVYSIDCYDAFGVLDESRFPGGVYTNYSAQQLLQDISGTDFHFAFEAADTTLTGILKEGTKRQAMQQVLFAWGACASTDGRDTIRVFDLPAEAQSIGKGRTFSGVTVDTAAIVTAVRMSAHTYTQDSGGNVEINGVKYKDTETVYTVANPNVTATDKQNVIEVKDATLVSPAIGQTAAQRVYDYYARRNTSNARIVWNSEKLGDRLTLPNAWGESNTGNLERMEIKLSNAVVAACEVLGV